MIAAIGLGALWLGRDWPTGTLAAVQSGFFPRLLSVLLLVFGTIVAVRGMLIPGEGLSAWAWRPLLGVTVAVLAFAAALESLGLVAAVLLLVGLGNLAGQPLRLVPLAALGAGLALGCIALFVWGLGLPIQVWP
ncbi:tripartite tricarboxylate transporter TctB family protein [Azospirillum sp. sgz302134]